MPDDYQVSIANELPRDCSSTSCFRIRSQQFARLNVFYNFLTYRFARFFYIVAGLQAHPEFPAFFRPARHRIRIPDAPALEKGFRIRVMNTYNNTILYISSLP